MSSVNKDIVLVTGSSGFLGQHIVKLLQEKDDEVEEIRLFDSRPYKNNLGHEEKKPMKHIIGDLRNMQKLEEALTGVTCVIHAAAVIDVSLFSDRELLEYVNVNGTKNVIDACIKKNVPKLIFTSSVDVCIGGEHIFYGTESTTPIPKKFLMGPYAETKCRAEQMILDASGTLLNDGETKLRTLSLRPTVIYGEEDRFLVTSILRMAKENNGIVRRIHSLDERLQMTYVGNAAWAHIKAKQTIGKDESVSGEAFFVTDDTPIIDIYENIRPFVEERGFKLSEYVIPYWIVFLFLFFIASITRLISFVFVPPWRIQNPSTLDYICSTFFFNRSKAILRLGYQPIYTPEESREKSITFYSKVQL
ncbi:3 beta-hydroxysteroid dehydrogenase/Delta 5--_4-isomerase type 3-like [Centruroides sculpturatus]|uniref:3 beta-hydroxysteroid dehydrogenase/Delta 5-->4-isomerase type 3-like n=1 Tax=Centruroides sculpturatus TaxID=218467 RepID=UPI000C6C8C99|nr:3 beta-hydroxysteroid dehydrogenase/Delta 5-->4-isomerase type 3-like [Centruroides sculpturatus]